MNLNQSLCVLLPAERVKTRLIDRYAFASNASHYFIVPKAVVQPIDIGEIQQLFAFSHTHKIPMVFRAAGTSLSGQAATDGILVDLSRYWRTVQAENEGAQVRTQPGVIGANVNVALKKYGRKMGPDPASITACMMGGILSNNASGMCCGVKDNSYHTMRSIKFVLPNGLVFNTELPEDYTRFETEASEISQGLKILRGEVLANRELMERIRSKYKQKNTTGYSLNAFLDFEHPLDILAHLLIGAEGTLAFIAEAVLKTLPDLPYKMTGLLYFENPETACSTIFQLKETGAEALELMDRASLRSVENMAGVPPLLKTLTGRASAILVEYQSDTEGGLLEKFEKAKPVLNALPLIVAPNFTQNADEQAMMWKIRKGLYPSAAAIRAKKTSAMLEDFTFPVEKLGDAIVDIQHLFEKYGYHNGIIFGHAKDGNLHFCVAQDFSDSAAIQQFHHFNEDLFELILKKYDGALKAEHGTGRAVAPYVEAEWGSEAYQIMKKLKALIDPNRLLNPDVILTEDKNLHLRDLKIMPVVEEEVDKCVECGYCERRCPSRDLTLTPRQRISVRRSIKILEETNQTELREELLKDYQFNGMDTCAVDGMCATDCPVSINTGDLIKRLRRENHSPNANKLALRLAKNFNLFEKTSRFAVRSSHGMNYIFGQNFTKNLTKTIRNGVPTFPLWSNQISQPSIPDSKFQIPNSRFQIPNSKFQIPDSNIPRDSKISDSKISITEEPLGILESEILESLGIRNQESKIVYFPSCISRIMGGDIIPTFQRVCLKAKVQLIIPKDINGTCCGQIFSSKGFTDAYRFTANQTFEKLWKITEGGTISVVMDGSSCTNTLQTSRPYLTPENQALFDKLKILDSVDFAADILLPRLTISKPKNRIVFHPVCSLTKMGLLGKLQKIGKYCAVEADIPTFSGCCGMAGDRGFYYPELTNAATKIEATEVNLKTYDGYYSSGKTCEMALSEAVGHQYESILKLLDEVS